MFGSIGKALKKAAKSPFKAASSLVQGDIPGVFNAANDAFPLLKPAGNLVGLGGLFEEPKPLEPIDYSSMYGMGPTAAPTEAVNTFNPVATIAPPPKRGQGIRATPIAAALMQRRDNQANDRTIGDRTI